MPFQQLRRALLTAACALPFVLAACGGGGNDIVSEFRPQRLVVFGDAFADAGQRNGVRYTINDGSAVNWTESLASNFDLVLAPSSRGGTSYAIGSARIVARPDAAGNAATPTIAQQVTAFLNAGSLAESDLVVITGGTADVIAEARTAGSEQQAEANAAAAGTELGEQVRRLVSAGAQHVMVVGTYNLGRSPWALGTGRETYFENLSRAFNDALKIAIREFDGRQVLYVDAALYFNLVTSNALNYGFTDVTSISCNSVDPGPGIGTGPGQVSSALCNGNTLAVANPGTTLFADRVYFTPAGNSNFGRYAYDRARESW